MELAEPERRGGETSSASVQGENGGRIRILVDKEEQSNRDGNRCKGQKVLGVEEDKGMSACALDSSINWYKSLKISTKSSSIPCEQGNVISNSTQLKISETTRLRLKEHMEISCDWQIKFIRRNIRRCYRRMHIQPFR